MKERIDSIGGRKVMIFLISVAIGVGASFFMGVGHYKEFLNFVVYSAIAFFAGNGMEHVAGAFKK